MRAGTIPRRREHSPAPLFQFIANDPHANHHAQHWALDPSGRVFVSPIASAAPSPAPDRAFSRSPELQSRPNGVHCTRSEELEEEEPFLLSSPENNGGDGESSFALGRPAVLLGTADRINSSAASFTCVESKSPREEGPLKEKERKSLCSSSHRISRLSSSTHRRSASHRMNSSRATRQHCDGNGKEKSSGKSDGSPNYSDLLAAVGALQDVVAQLSGEIRELRLVVNNAVGHGVAQKSQECQTGSDMEHNDRHSEGGVHRSGSTQTDPLPGEHDILEAVSEGLRELDALPSSLPQDCRAVIEAAQH